jgi:hypothetical protein
MCRHPDGSLATLKRFGVRLVAAAFFAALWPHRSNDEAVAILSLIMAAVCALAAATGREPVRGRGLTRWDEAAALLAAALLFRLFF